MGEIWLVAVNTGSDATNSDVGAKTCGEEMSKSMRWASEGIANVGVGMTSCGAGSPSEGVGDGEALTMMRGLRERCFFDVFLALDPERGFFTFLSVEGSNLYVGYMKAWRSLMTSAARLNGSCS